MNIRRPASALIEWSRTDRAAGITLALGTVGALVWANVDGASYSRTWAQVPTSLGFTGLQFSWRDWVNDGLMTFFFIVIGLEIRRETTAGELGSWQRAAAPVIAAIAGMALPALAYAAIVHGGVGGHGWGIPMATDVAFSLGALALVASSASLRLRVFLMTLGVADDILSILVLVTFYSAEVGAGFIAAGLVCLVVMFVVRTFPDPLGAVALLLAAVAWWTFARGGVEAAVVGVALGLGGLASTGPTARRGLGPRAWEHRVNPGVNLFVLPVFAIANAGVDLAHLDLASSVALRVFVAVLVARVVGKPLGVWLGATLAPSRFVSPSDERPPTRLRLGLGTVASVGFTVSLLITRVAFGEGALADAATAALLLGTVIGLVLTSALLRPTREG